MQSKKVLANPTTNLNTITQALIQAKKLGRSDLVYEAYQKIKLEKAKHNHKKILMDEYSYGHLIQILGNDRKTDKIFEVIKDAIADERVNKILFVNAINAGRDNNDLNLVWSAYKTAHEIRLAQEDTYSAVIIILGNAGDIQGAFTVLTDAIEAHAVNCIVFSAFVTAAKKNDQPNLVYDAYERVKIYALHYPNIEILDTRNYSSAILSGENDKADIQKNWQIFKDAINAKKTSSALYTSAITVAKRHGNISLVREAFMLAKEEQKIHPDKNIVTEITFGVVMSSLFLLTTNVEKVWRGLINEAVDTGHVNSLLFSNAVVRNVCKKTSPPTFSL